MIKPTFRQALVCAAFTFVAAQAADADAARVGVLSNKFFAETAADFNANVGGHTFTGIDVSGAAPLLATLTANYDVLLLFEDGTFANSPNVGNVVAAFAATGRPVVLGAFYDQDRSDAPPATITPPPHGWGALEAIDPNTTDGNATPYALRTLNASTLVASPLTAGVTSLTSAKYAGGNDAKPGTVVVAAWTQPNARGKIDPAIDYRVSGLSCVIHVAIAPQYPTIGTAGVDFGGDFYRAWRNSFDLAANSCIVATAGAPGIPTLSSAGLALTALLVAAIGFIARRRPAQLPRRR
jgi:hypothetical protein